MRKIFKIIKRIFQFSVLTLGVLYSLVYIIISLPAVQDKLCRTGEEILAETLEVPINISRMEFSPFNRIELFDVTIPDQQGDTLLYANKLGVGIDVIKLITDGKIRLRNIQMFGLDVHITQSTPTSPTNIQFIIDAFQPKKDREPKPIDLAINSALIRRSKVRYDILSEPHKEPGVFDPNHIMADDLTANLAIKAFNKDTVNASVKRLSLKEQSGVKIERLAFRVESNREKSILSQFALQLPQSHIATREASIEWNNLQDLKHFADSAYITLGIAESQIVLSDIAPIVPIFSHFHSPISLDGEVKGYVNDIDIEHLTLNMDDDAVHFNTQGEIRNLLHRDSLYLDISTLQLASNDAGITLVGENLNIQDEKTLQTLHNLGYIIFNSNISGYLSDLNTHSTLYTGIGDIALNGQLKANPTFDDIVCKAMVETDGIDLTNIVGEKSQLGIVAFSSDLSATIGNKKLSRGNINTHIDRIDYRQYSYTDIDIKGKCLNDKYEGKITLQDPNATLNVEGKLNLKKKNSHADLKVTCSDIDLAALNLAPQSQGNKLSFNIDALFTGNSFNNANGHILIDDFSYGNNESLFVWDELLIKAQNDTFPQQLTIQSDYINGHITGSYDTSTLLQTLQELAHPIVPSLISKAKKRKSPTATDNNFHWYINFKPNVQMSQTFKLPFTLTDTACIDGYMHGAEQNAHLHVAAPNIWLGKTHMEKMSINVSQQDEKVNLAAQTDIINHLKEVTTTWNLDGNAHNDRIDMGISWDSNTSTDFSGEIKLDALLSRNAEDNKKTDVAIKILPTTIVMNDSLWNIKPANISIKDKDIAVNKLEISRPSQHIFIDGKISENIQDTVHVDLQEINLDYIFETLNIDFVTFGGTATGRVNAANVYSKAPHIATQNLDIREFSYNDAVFGDLSIMSIFDLTDMSILLKGFITNKRGQESVVDGYIFPTRDSLSIAFDVDHVPLKFLRPFVGTILLDVDGEASGEVVLEGNFERIYIYGDAYAHNFSFGVPFINTYYNLSDSVHFTKDQIRFDNVTVYDNYGNSTYARGVLNHKYFAQLEYDIDIYDADNMHVFNVPHTPGAMFYGNIFGSGNVSVKGNDYRTDIDVNMTANRNSEFTYALTTTMSAIDYPFLSFTNKREKVKPVENVSTISKSDSAVIANNMILLKANKPQMPLNTLYLNIEANITPDIDITLVMNEMTGDDMKANGEGVLRMEYNTATNEVMMYGTVVIDKGIYNFSMEEIIRRNFTINSGSSVSFQGNPLNAQLNIDATYALQANLADLDASFANDSELTRTTVPVNAKLLIQGDMMTPNIGFDIELPTLSADMDSKMRSIVNSEEMMTRQVIYLLALNRFYTTDYNSSYSSNEMSALTTSVLSSSLGSLMGQFSENWNISPNLRSEQGDFTDLEVDLYLSSQLLNNRLIFNGNIGYRDSRYSSTNFIGDFDIEYLLNENGTLRLKGYNHFNDRNYSLRTALTTQGIGLIYKHDFNTWSNFFEFYKPKKKLPKEKPIKEVETFDSDSIIQPVDTVITTVPDIFE